MGLMGAMFSSVAAQSGSIKGEMLTDWSDLKARMVGIASEMPAEEFTFKPTPPQQSYGERVMHVATANVRFLGALGGKSTAPTIDPKVTTKEAAIQALADSFDYGTALLNEQTDETMLQ